MNMKEEKNLPIFKYHPNIDKDDIVLYENAVCDCCGKEVNAYIKHFYGSEDLKVICLDCVADGSAASKFNVSFVDHAEKVSDQNKVDELFHKTPGYNSWQGENWLACCDDFCEYLGRVGIDELNDLGLTDELIANYQERANKEVDIDYIKNNLTKDGDMNGYLFRCSHCDKYHLWIDEN